MFVLVLTLTITLRVSSLGKKTQTQRRSCMVLLLWKFSLFIFMWLEQDRRLCLQMGLWAHRWPPRYHQPLLVQLQSLIDIPVTGGSAGREVLTGRSMGTPAAELQGHNTGETVIQLCMNKKCLLLMRNSTNVQINNMAEICWNQICHLRVLLTFKLY